MSWRVRKLGERLRCGESGWLYNWGAAVRPEGGGLAEIRSFRVGGINGQLRYLPSAKVPRISPLSYESLTLS